MHGVLETKRKRSFTARKAQFINRQQDGIKIRACNFKTPKTYNRKDKSWKKEAW